MKPLRIVLVDDDAVISSLLSEMLEDMGHVVCGVEATEAGAVQAWLSHRPDLMIVDAQLTGGSGIAAVDAIARVASVRHILMSGGDFPEGQSPPHLLRKPFFYHEMVKAIERATASPLA